MYKRKTKDIYELWTNYGYGWECEVWEKPMPKSSSDIRSIVRTPMRKSKSKSAEKDWRIKQ